MKMRKNIELIAMLMVLLAAWLFTACDGGAMEELWKDELGNGCTVTFVSNGGSEVASQTIKKGECAAKPQDPTFGENTFSGWFLKGSSEEFNFSTPITEDITLYAHWQGLVETNSSKKPINLTEGDIIEVAMSPIPSKETSVSIPAGAIPGTGSHSSELVVTSYSIEVSTAVFEISGSSDDNIAVAGIDCTLKIDDEIVSDFKEPVIVTTYIPKGLSFVQVVYNGDDGKSQPVAGDSHPDTNIAKVFTSDSEMGDKLGYSKESGKLRFKTEHFSEFYVATNAEVCIVNDSDKTDISAMTLAEFRDSVKGGKTYEGYTVTVLKDGSDVPGLAGVAPINKSVAVTLDYTSGGTVYSSDDSWYDSEQVTVKTGETIKLDFTSPTVTGRTLEGFYVELDCTRKVANADGTLVSNVSGYTDANGKWTKAEKCTLYAGWSYIISFRGGDGSGERNDVKVSRKAKFEILDCTFTAPAFTPKTGTVPAAHMSFAGWNTKADGSGTAYAVGKEILSVTSDMTLYAQWTKPLFSVSSDKKVYFSKGNLQAKYNGSSYTFDFAKNQYDRIGNTAGNTTIGSQENNAVVDLFCWSTDVAQSNWGIHTMTNEMSGYYDFVRDSFKDWGLFIDSLPGNDSTTKVWRTLSKDEWTYLLNKDKETTRYRQDANRFAKARVNNVNGLLIFPDGYNGGTEISGITGVAEVNTSNVNYPNYNIDDDTWTAMEEAGVVFLPAAGYRYGSNVNRMDDMGYYWSATLDGAYSAYDFIFYSSGVSSVGYIRCYGCSVRLVCEEKLLE